MNGVRGRAALEAVEQFGTPLYLYDLARLRADARAVREAFPEPWLRLYSLKANGLPALVREICAQGLAVSAVSGGEVGLAQRAGVAPRRMVLEGVGKPIIERSSASMRSCASTHRSGPRLWERSLLAPPRRSSASCRRSCRR